MKTNFKPVGMLTGLLVLSVLLFPACAVHKPITGAEPPEPLPDSFSGGETLAPVDRWWGPAGASSAAAPRGFWSPVSLSRS